MAFIALPIRALGLGIARGGAVIGRGIAVGGKAVGRGINSAAARAATVHAARVAARASQAASRPMATGRVNQLDVARTMRKTRELPIETNEYLVYTSQEAAAELTKKVRAAARASGRQSAIVAPAVSVVTSRRPIVMTIQHTELIGRNNTPARNIAYGSEFGAHRYPQFRPYKPRGYWFHPTIDANEFLAERAMAEAVDYGIENWGAGSDAGRNA